MLVAKLVRYSVVGKAVGQPLARPQRLRGEVCWVDVACDLVDVVDAMATQHGRVLSHPTLARRPVDTEGSDHALVVDRNLGTFPWYDRGLARLPDDDPRRGALRLKKFVAAQVAWHWLHGDYGRSDAV